MLEPNIYLGSKICSAMDILYVYCIFTILFANIMCAAIVTIPDFLYSSSTFKVCGILRIKFQQHSSTTLKYHTQTIQLDPTRLINE